MLTTLIIFSVVNILLADADANLIIKGKWIKHGINGLVYAAMLAVPYFIFHNYWLMAALLMNRLLFFNIFLSLFRKLDWDYMSEYPKAITDKIQKFIFGTHGKAMYAIYFIIFTLLIYLSYANR